MDRFAGAFLVPAAHLKNELGAEETTPSLIEELVRLKHLYGVSMWALLHRLKRCWDHFRALISKIFFAPPHEVG